VRLHDTVKRFSTELFLDGYDSSVSFFGRIDPFAEITNSGPSSERRILEVAPDITIPSTHVIEDSNSQIFIVGNPNTDFWANEVIRFKHSVVPTTENGSVGTIGEILAGTETDTDIYIHEFFVRRELHDEERSDYLSGYEIYFSQVHSFVRGQVFKSSSDFYRLKTDTWIDGVGFSVAQAVKLESPIQTFNIQSNSTVYDPVDDDYTNTPLTDVDVFVEPLEQDYEFVSPSFSGIELGDKAISVLKSDAPNMTVNDHIGGFRVISIRDMGDWITCQSRYLS